jgi:hypothetical protein
MAGIKAIFEYLLIIVLFAMHPLLSSNVFGEEFVPCNLIGMLDFASAEPCTHFGVLAIV